MTFLSKLQKLIGQGPEWDVMDFAEREEREDEYQWFAVEPSVIYPQTIGRIVDVLQRGIYPEELLQLDGPEGVDPHSAGQLIIEDARLVPMEAWEKALQPRQDIAAEYVPVRAAALNIARRWFTQAIRCSVKRPVGVHITRDVAYKL